MDPQSSTSDQIVEVSSSHRQTEAQMDPQSSSDHIVDDVSSHRQTLPKACAGGRCAFFDAHTRDRDARERSASKRKLWIALALSVVFFGVEIAGGVISNSLAILGDALHLLADVAGFGIALLSLWAAGREATPRRSYGCFRVEILGSLLSVLLIWVFTGVLVYEAIDRLVKGDAGEVKGPLMFVISAFGLLVNIATAVLLGHVHGHGHGHDHGHGDHDHGADDDDDEHGHSPVRDEPPRTHVDPANINVQGAYLHVLGDSIQSIGVMIGGGIIWYKPEWKIVDLICTLVFAVIVALTTLRMICRVLQVLMESTPGEINATRLEQGLCEMEEVAEVHELHIWAITVGKVVLSCHVKIKPDADADLVLDKATDYIKREFNISHVTIQIEREECV